MINEEIFGGRVLQIALLLMRLHKFKNAKN